MSHAKPKPDGGNLVNLSLIITPFLDFAFQLLAFFIMTYNPSSLEGHIDGTLVPPSVVVDPDPLRQDQMIGDDEPDLGESVLVRVKAVARGQHENNRGDGQPSRILMKRPEDADAVTVADTNTTLEEGLRKLEIDLRTVLKQSPAGKHNIKLDGDADLKHLYLMRVYDVCRAAGYTNIAFVAPKIERK